MASEQGRLPEPQAPAPNASGFRKPPVHLDDNVVPDPTARRQVIKIHGMSIAPGGQWLFAVSLAKSKNYRYLTRDEMIAKYPSHLIGFYERSLTIGPVPAKTQQNESNQ
jgi:hypothetical protein